MGYCLKLDASVIKRIVGFDLPGNVMRDILAGIDLVGEDPAGHLLRIGPPDDAMQFDLVIHDSGPPIRRFLFVFTVKYDADEETIHVVNCNYIFDERSE